MLNATRALVSLAFVSATASFAPAPTLPLLSVISGNAFYDFNNNGVWDRCQPTPEVPIAGWKVEIYKKVGECLVLNGTTFTNGNGRYTFVRNLDCARYLIREVAPAPGFVPARNAVWLASTPTEGWVTANACDVPGPQFGDLRFESKAGAGRPKEFWQGASGKALLQANDPQWRIELNAVCLRWPISTPCQALSILQVPVNVCAYPVPFCLAFAAWSLYVGVPPMDHAGYMLSVQVAAVILNHKFGFLKGPIYVNRRQDGVLVSLDAMIHEAVTMLLCDPRASQSGPCDPYPAFRAQILGCINEFETINNTGSTVNPQIVFAPAPGPGEITYGG